MDDLTGFVLGLDEQWDVLRLPAIAEHDEEISLRLNSTIVRRAGEALFPRREPLHVLESLRQQLGSDVFSAQYQQSPVPPGGAMIKRHWVKRYSGSPPGHEVVRIFQSWDVAAKGGPDNDWSVCTTWAEMRDCRWYLLDIWRDRVNYPNLKANVAELARKWNAHQVLVEEAGTAIGLIEELSYKVRGLTGVRPELSKEARMAIASAKFEAGQVFFPERAAWLPELEAELFAFPGSRHDDQVDSISQALRHDSPAAQFARIAKLSRHGLIYRRDD
jgi:predicted phage terminase large subunit-like protein